MEKFRTKIFCAVLYEEDETHKKAIEYIRKNYDHAMVCHDKDVYLEDVIRNGELVHKKGDLEKAHYQIVFRFSNARWNTAVAEELGIKENYLEAAETFKGALTYLVHLNNPEKFQYSIDDVEGPLKNRLEEYIRNADKTESEKVLEIFEEIDSFGGEIDFKVFCKHIAKIGYWDVLRRSSGLIIRYVDEHNKKM